ncbi:type IV pilus assembly protein PilW [Neisseria sp. HSC-16F19]|nr:type IV pilus assembly protein PilW [Neisseria sp. HSC-16F19]
MAQVSKGFSLIEFLVASAISMIVLIAAGSTYFMTRQLNHVASERLVAQQDLRNAATLIIRDARQAGTFGCANLAGTSDAMQTHVTNPYAISHPLGLRTEITDDQPNGFGLRVMPGGNFIGSGGANISNFTPEGNALIFVYGDGYASVNDYQPHAPNPVVNATALVISTDSTGATAQALAATTGTAPIVLSSCNKVQILQRSGSSGYSMDSGNIKLNPSLTITNVQATTNLGAFMPGQLNISKLAASAYVVGRITSAAGSSNGLYRFNLAPDGTWSGPQLLVANMADTNAMSMQFGYVKTNTCIDNASAPNETFTFTNTPSTLTDHSKLPALIRITLNVKDGSNRASGVDVGTISAYVIDATIRNGNICANRGMG